MGLELTLFETIKALRSARLVTLTLVWSWIIGPALAYLITLLLPLVLGAVIKVYAGQFAARILPYFKKLAGLTTLALLGFTVVTYSQELVQALGSYAVAAQVLFVVVTAFGSYALGFGMNEAQRSALALGICSRNGGAMFVAFGTFSVQDPNVLVMILLAVPVPVIVWLLLARYFASRADGVATRAGA